MQSVSIPSWHTVIVEDGHNIEEIQKAFGLISKTDHDDRAKTIKGKGVSFLENKDGWHGKPVPKLDEASRTRRSRHCTNWENCRTRHPEFSS